MIRTKGFTLIEVLVTVAIIGILTAIALPSYKSYITKGKLTEATSNLIQLSGLQESFYRDFRVYAGGSSLSGSSPTSQGGLDGTIVWDGTSNNYFTYTISNNAGATTAAGQGYVITATGVIGTPTSQYMYTINSNNLRCTRADSNLIVVNVDDTNCPAGSTVW